MVWNWKSFCIPAIGGIDLNIIELFFKSLPVCWTLIHGTCLFVCQAPDDAAHVLPSSDPTAHLLPNKIKDFTAFINLVDFCRYWRRHTWEIGLPDIIRVKLISVKPADTLIVIHSTFIMSASHCSPFCSELLLNKHVEYFQSWMYPLSHELILHSIRNPLVSGFYKLLSVTMKIAKRIKYYQVIFPLVENIFCHNSLCLPCQGIWKIIRAGQNSTIGSHYRDRQLCFTTGLTN